MLSLLVNLNADWIRWTDFTLSFIALAAITANMTARRKRINRRTRRILLWIYCLLLYTSYATGAAIKHHDPIGVTTYFGLFVFAGLILSIIWHPAGDERTPPNDGSVGQWLLVKIQDGYNRIVSKTNK